jgi:hypothetical protein
MRPYQISRDLGGPTVKKQESSSADSFVPDLIAPCGMNCGLCIGYLRVKNRCPGCLAGDAGKNKSCVQCRIKTCPELSAAEGRFCHECVEFPCARLRQLDKRYRTKYGMSMVENLETIRDIGLEGFVAREKERWKCANCGGVVCVHRPNCLYCGQSRE